MKLKNSSNKYYKIWEVVDDIPYGKVATYGQVARMAGFPSHARLAGYALHHLPEGSSFPWFRVVNSQGRISFPKNTPMYKQQKKLLEKEKIVFINDRVDMKKYQWKK
ncbi:MGMT family protein [bacterium]|nr:MGMT family protein [bacterium]